MRIFPHLAGPRCDPLAKASPEAAGSGSVEIDRLDVKGIRVHARCCTMKNGSSTSFKNSTGLHREQGLTRRIQRATGCQESVENQTKCSHREFPRFSFELAGQPIRLRWLTGHVIQSVRYTSWRIDAEENIRVGWRADRWKIHLYVPWNYTFCSCSRGRTLLVGSFESLGELN